MLNKNNLTMIDILSLFGFFIGLANYEENVDIGKMNNSINNAVEDIHNHLSKQDKKIDSIIEVLGGKDYEE